MRKSSYERAMTLAALCGFKIALGPAFLATAHRRSDRSAWVAGAMGEMVLDKLGVFPPRYRPSLLIPHTLAGAWVARESMKEDGNDDASAAVMGAVVAAGVACIAPVVRIVGSKVLGIPDALLGVAEDALALSLGAQAMDMTMSQLPDVAQEAVGDLSERDSAAASNRSASAPDAPVLHHVPPTAPRAASEAKGGTSIARFGRMCPKFGIRRSPFAAVGRFTGFPISRRDPVMKEWLGGRTHSPGISRSAQIPGPDYGDPPSHTEVPSIRTEQRCRLMATSARVNGGKRGNSPGDHHGIPLPAPMLCTLVEHPIDDPGWAYEPKFDGLRLIARSTAGPVAPEPQRQAAGGPIP